MANRRSFLQSGLLALGTLPIGNPVAFAHRDRQLPQTPLSSQGIPFHHRGYLGWITDLASQPDEFTAWPSMRLDERLLNDYETSFDILQRLGFNEISIWGLYVSRSWPLTIECCVTPSRGAMVERLIERAHAKGIRVLSGLGIYSWGFDEIIAANPPMNRGNPHAMCASEPVSWEWMRKVIDYVFTRFPIDGVSMQSADQGRCRCERCSSYSDAEYHALLNTRASEYIRNQWPKKTIGVNSWGLRFGDPSASPALEKMSRNIDYLIDVHDSSRSESKDYRKQLIRTLKCDFGTLGGPQVEPPQHWRRDQWFLPTAKRTSQHLTELAADGGRACEYYFHILENPGDEFTLWIAGKSLSDPSSRWEKKVQDSIEDLYETSRESIRDGLAELFLQSEDAYFKHRSGVSCGTLSLEPLIGDRPGSAIYLSESLNAAQRDAYANELRTIKTGFEKLSADVPPKSRIKKVIRCIENVLHDLEQLRR